MLTPTECQKLVREYKSLAQQPNVSRERSVMLINIARTLSGLATQLDRLAAHMRDQAKEGRVSAANHSASLEARP